MSGHFPTFDFAPDQRQEMQRVSASLPTKSAKIRALHAAGYTRSQIAAFLGIRYQHVRNVLVNHPGRSGAGAGGGEPVDPSPETEPDSRKDWPTFGLFVVDERGRIVLPSSLLDALEIHPGSSIPWRFEGGELKVMGRDAGIRFAQSVIAALAEGRSGAWSDDLIAERRAEAVRESSEALDA